MHHSSASPKMSRAYRIGVHALLAAIVVQFLLAGLGIFAGAQFFFLHGTVNAALIFLGGLLLLGIGWRARVGRRSLQLTGAIPALVVLQSILLAPYHLDVPAFVRAIASLHVVNALLIFWVGIVLLERVRGSRDAQSAQEEAAPQFGERR